MTRNTSLRRIIVVSVVVACCVLVACYTMLLRSYLMHGLNMDKRYHLESEARYYLSLFRENPDTPLPRTGTITGYLDYASLPEPVRSAFARNQLVSGSHLQTESHKGTRQLFFIHTVARPDGKPVYFVQRLDMSTIPAQAVRDYYYYYLYIPVGIGVTTIALILGLALFMLRRVARPVEDLRNWAMQVEVADLGKGATDFRFAELNQLADLFRSNLRRLSDGVEREKRFQQYASHELRTPIAILKNNLELLERKGMLEHAGFASAFGRMEKAVKKMQYLTETLLWAFKERGTPLPDDEIDLGALVSDVIDENTFLLVGKQVALDLQLARVVLHGPKTVVRIVCNNLIRNAFQHTPRGVVRIASDRAGIIIANDKAPLAADQDGQDAAAPQPRGQEGFGLGLQLTRVLVEQLDWELHVVEDDTTFTVDVRFDAVKVQEAEPTA